MAIAVAGSKGAHAISGPGTLGWRHKNGNNKKHKAIKIISIAPNIKTSLAHAVSVFLIALFDNLINVTKIGNTTGKLRIAIIVAELLALAAMAEIKVKVILKPILPSKIARKY